MRRIEFIDGQRALLAATLARFAGPGDRYALLDVPEHGNVGDSAIWLGAREMLGRVTGRPPVHVAGHGAGGLIGLRRRLGPGTIYINGGGNFGDLWVGSQRLRERLLARFPDNRIVQLPQSIHFESERSVRRCAEAIRRHGNFHLLVRDDASAAFAGRRFECPVTLTPDCAFGLGALAPSRAPRHALFALLREDKESTRADRAPLEALGPHIEDWIAEPRRPAARVRLALWAGILRSNRLAGGASRLALCDRMALWRLRRGIRALSSGSQVITDRLHGHILCLLLGIPHVALDNSYGKISAYHRTWTRGIGGAAFADDAAEAVAALAGLPHRLQISPAEPVVFGRAA